MTLTASLSRIFAFAFSLSLLYAWSLMADSYRVYVGTYTGNDSKGIYLFEFDGQSGSASEPRLVAETVNPSFLAIHPARNLLYAVNETGDFGGKSSGAVSAFSMNAKTGDLTFLNQQASEGAAPCHLVIDQTGKHVLVANYNGGNVSVLPIGENGKLGTASDVVQHIGSSVNPRRQEKPHAHSINLDRWNRFAFAADLGVDKVLSYRFDSARGKLDLRAAGSASVEPGSGPRHFAFHPSGQYAYVINELLLTVTAFQYKPGEGALSAIQTISTIPGERQNGYSTAEVQVHPSGKFLYGSNRGHDSIVVFKIDEQTGRLTYVENEPTQGRTPRNFGIDPTGKFLLAENQGSNTIVIFRIDQETGELEATGGIVNVPTPVCVKFVSTPK